MYKNVINILFFAPLAFGCLSHNDVFAASNKEKKTLVTDKTPEAKRLEVLKPFFNPPIGGWLFADGGPIPPFEPKDWVHYGGWIEVNPPAGTCFTITRSPDIEDDIVCKKARLPWSIAEFNSRGELEWLIRTGPDDFGAKYIWRSRHRVAQVIRIGKKEVQNIPVRYCTAQRLRTRRRIVLEMLNDERWVINLPNEEKSSGVTYTPPNLYISKKKQNEGGIPSGSGDNPTSLFSGEGIARKKQDDSVGANWGLSKTNTYVMSSENFLVGDVVPGMRGKCRYEYRGAPTDHQTGWIECHDTANFEVVAVPLTCIGELEQKNPDSP